MDWKRYGFIALIIIVLVGVVVLVGASQDSPEVIIVSMLTTTIAVATPLTLGALSGVFCERAGVVNIGIEGMMLSAAFFGWFGAVYCNTILKLPFTACMLIGVVAAILTGGLMGLLHAWLSVTFKVDQIIGGTVINLLAMGITGFLNRQIFFESGSVFGGQVPHAPGTLPRLPIPLLSDIPVFGKLFDQQPITWAAILLVVVVTLRSFLHTLGAAHSCGGRTPARCRYGGHQRDPHALCQRDHRRVHRRAGWGVFYPRVGSLLRTADDQWARFHLPGSHDLRQLVTFRGLGCFPGLRLSEALQINLQQYRELIPPAWAFLQQAYIVGLVPYILTMLILTGIIGKTTPPAADGVPYEK